MGRQGHFLLPDSGPFNSASHLTTDFGAPVPDNQNSMTAGPRGPLLMQDVWLLEKLANLNREVIPERRMHAKGSGAFGTFTVTHDITRFTRARLFEPSASRRRCSPASPPWPASAGPPTPSATSAASPSSSTPRRATGTIVGNNTPVFFVRDPRHFGDLNKAVKRDPRTNLRSATNNWDFWTSLPEALHQITIVMSDRGIPASYRHMHGFGSHTYSFINAAGERFGSSSTSGPSRASRTSATPRPPSWSAGPREPPARPLSRRSSAATSRSGHCRSR
jgi:catalase